MSKFDINIEGSAKYWGHDPDNTEISCVGAAIKVTGGSTYCPIEGSSARIQVKSTFILRDEKPISLELQFIGGCERDAKVEIYGDKLVFTNKEGRQEITFAIAGVA